MSRFLSLPLLAALLLLAAGRAPAQTPVSAPAAPAVPPAKAAPAVAAPAAAPAPAPVSEPAIPGKVAYVDMELLFQGYYKTAQFDASFKRQKQLYEGSVAEGVAQLEKERKELAELKEKAINIALSDEARLQARNDAQDLEGRIRQKERELRDFFQSKDKELNRKYLELRNEIVREISEFVRTQARKGRYEALFDVSGLTRNFIPAVVYHDDRQDITRTLLAELNRGREKEARPVEEILKERKEQGVIPLPEAPAASR
ncbi:MAG: OmpH family outer membrane protein [Lentisphaeria bacterium]|jgi:Skp family chaperone for outer membrane proteins